MESFQNLVAALGHSLWQGVLIGVFLWAILSILPTRWTRARYVATLAALALILFAVGATWRILQHPEVWHKPTPISAAVTTEIPTIASPPESTHTIPQHPTPLPAARQLNWKLYAGILWAIGVALMLIRMGFGLGRARSLVEMGKPIEIPALQDLAQRLGISRVHALASEAYRIPAVVGAWWPIVLVPASLLTEMSPAQLRMILAHELAHIRRHDYLINLVQQIIEALLFFNPAVWWISRQVRIEREACCDALAVKISGNPLLMAQTLTEVAGRISAYPSDLPIAALAATGPRRSSLLDRVKRLLSGGQRMPLSFPGWTLGTALLVSTLILTLIGTTAQLTVRAAEQLMTPEQRVEKVAELQKELGNARVSVENLPRVKFTGTVRTEDGMPIPPEAHVRACTLAGSSSTHSMTQIARDGTFTYEAPATTAFFYISTNGYAPAISDILRPGPDGQFPAIDIVLRKGFRASINLVGTDGKRVMAAKNQITFWYPVKIGNATYQVSINDDYDIQDNQLTLPNALPRPLEITVDTPGYQYTRAEVQIAQGQQARFELAAARPTRGKVIDATSGQPIPGARFVLMQRDNSTNWTPRENPSRPPYAVSDESGQFTLDRLQDGVPHAFWVAGENHGAQIFTDVFSGRSDLVVRLGPPRVVRFEIRPGADPLPPQITVVNPVRLGNTVHNNGVRLPIRIQDNGTGIAELHDPVPGYVSLTLGTREIKVDPDTAPNPVIVDLRQAEAPAKTRELVFKFDYPKDGAAPRGKFSFHYTRPDRLDSFVHAEIDTLNGLARMEVPVPTRVSISQSALAGYCFPDRSDIHVTDGPGPLEVKVALLPAGAIHGRILDEKGNLFTQYFYASVQTITPSPQLASSHFHIDGDNNNDASGKFLISPIPLGGTYRLIVSAGPRFATSEPLVIDDRNPIPQVELRFAEGVALRGRVFDPAGNPVPAATVELSFRNDFTSHSFDIKADGAGAFQFDHLDTAKAVYSVGVRPGKTYAGTTIANITPTETPLEIRLTAGLTARGRVLDSETGKPIPRRTISLSPVSGTPARYSSAIQVQADSEGNFEATGLEPIDYVVNIFGTYPPTAKVLRDPSGKVTGVQDAGDWKNNPKLRGGSPDIIEIKRLPSPWNE